jgi:hypothetical protein
MDEIVKGILFWGVASCCVRYQDVSEIEKINKKTSLRLTAA